jgi:hypothetical protein
MIEPLDRKDPNFGRTCEPIFVVTTINTYAEKWCGKCPYLNTYQVEPVCRLFRTESKDGRFIASAIKFDEVGYLRCRACLQGSKRYQELDP